MATSVNMLIALSGASIWYRLTINVHILGLRNLLKNVFKKGEGTIWFLQKDNQA